MSLRRFLCAGALVAVTALVLSAPAAVKASRGGGKPAFGRDIVLPGGQGGEPSIAIDTSPTMSRGDIYVGAIGDSNGPLEWHSYDGGKSWSQPVPFDLNGPLRGGDEDVAVNTNGDLLATDLDVSWASVQISTDQGKTFDAGTQTAPEDDRPGSRPRGRTSTSRTTISWRRIPSSARRTTVATRSRSAARPSAQTRQ